MQLITLIIFFIIGTRHTLHHHTHPHLSYKLQVTSYNLQHVFVSRDEWSSVGHADGHAEIHHHCNHRRRRHHHHSQIIFKKKKNN